MHPGLEPVEGEPLFILWDFGHNPTFAITQISPEGRWLVLDCEVGDDTGAYELIGDVLKPLLIRRYGDWFDLRRPAKGGRSKLIQHIGDPQGNQRDQTSIKNSPVRAIKREIGGIWKNGAVDFQSGVRPLRAVLQRFIGQTALLQVDRKRAKPIWHALRGGWHYHVSNAGLVSDEAEKDMHSHPGDTMRYGASILFPLGKLHRLGKGKRTQPSEPSYPGFGTSQGGLGFERPGLILPQ